jgi:hypothetical protein
VVNEKRCIGGCLRIEVGTMSGLAPVLAELRLATL